MTLSLRQAELTDAALIGNLFQFYHYDFSELLAGHVAEDGRFRTPALAAYWQDSWRHPWLLHVDEHPAGFALVQRRSRITGDPETWDMAEFFVMRAYRRQGVGSQAALQLFAQFRGHWEVRQIHANPLATHFWRAVIARHTGGHFSESTHDDDRWRGPVQSFDS
jgi:predicted acetyltransferase